VPIAGLSKEILDYTRASEHLIGAVMRRNTKFSEEELLVVKYYTDEVMQIVKGIVHPCGSVPHK
jgi:hypothetical protein